MKELRRECKKYLISIGTGVKIGRDVWIGRGSNIGNNVELQERVHIGSNVDIDANAKVIKYSYIGDDSTLRADKEREGK